MVSGRSAIDRWTKPGALLYAEHIGRPLEGFRSWLPGMSRPPDRSEELIQARRQIRPGELERLLRIVVDDLEFDPAAEIRRAAGHERMWLAIDHDGPAALEAEKNLLVARMPMLAHVAAVRRNDLDPHRD